MDVREVLPRDAIPSIDDPTFAPTFAGEGDNDVIVQEGSRARAYPVRILNAHEIVNDRLDGVPLAVTWCPLCGSAVVYERRLDGRELTFGVSGKLADDDLVMYDRETESEWKQTTGECIAGPLNGSTLQARAAPILPYTSFRDQYPEGTVLQPPRDLSDYDDAAYEAYVEGQGFGLDARRDEGPGDRQWDRTDLAPKERVLGVVHGTDALGFPRSRVDGIATASVGGLPVVVLGAPAGLFVYEDPGFVFAAAGSSGTVRGDGTRWHVPSGESADGRRLVRVPARRVFAFAWQDDHGPGAFYDG